LSAPGKSVLCAAYLQKKREGCGARLKFPFFSLGSYRTTNNRVKIRASSNNASQKTAMKFTQTAFNLVNPSLHSPRKHSFCWKENIAGTQSGVDQEQRSADSTPKPSWYENAKTLSK
jgi:hypothetical protein